MPKKTDSTGLVVGLLAGSALTIAANILIKLFKGGVQ